MAMVLASDNFRARFVAAGVNDHREQAEELATLLHHWNFSHVNLSPYNPIADSDFERPTKAKVCSLFLLGSFIFGAS